MKKIIISSFAVFLSMSLFSCGNPTSASTSTDISTSTSTSTTPSTQPSTSTPGSTAAVLDTPTNISIDEEGLITWDKVDNAKNYVVSINLDNYLTEKNFYQVRDLSQDFTYSVYAMGQGYENSPKSEEYTYVGTISKAVEEIKDYLSEFCFEEVGEEEYRLQFPNASKKLDEIILEASKVFVENGMTLELAQKQLPYLVSSFSHGELSNATVDYFLSLNVKEKANFVYFGGAIVDVVLWSSYYEETDDTLEGETSVPKSMYDGMTYALEEGGYDLATSISNIATKFLNAYLSFSIECLPDIIDYLNDPYDFTCDIDVLCDIRDQLVSLLKVAKINKADLATVIDFFLDYISIGSISYNYDDYESLFERLPDAIRPFVELAVSNILKMDFTTVTGDQIAEGLLSGYDILVNSIDEVTDEELEYLSELDYNSEQIGYIVSVVVENICEGIDYEGPVEAENVNQVLGFVYEIFRNSDEEIFEALGIEEEDYEESCSLLADGIEALRNTLGFVIENFKDILPVFEFDYTIQYSYDYTERTANEVAGLTYDKVEPNQVIYYDPGKSDPGYNSYTIYQYTILSISEDHKIHYRVTYISIYLRNSEYLIDALSTIISNQKTDINTIFESLCSLSTILYSSTAIDTLELPMFFAILTELDKNEDTGLFIKALDILDDYLTFAKNSTDIDFDAVFCKMIACSMCGDSEGIMSCIMFLFDGYSTQERYEAALDFIQDVADTLEDLQLLSILGEDITTSEEAYTFMKENFVDFIFVDLLVD
ncbi:MAG: hypothetical protein WCR67_02960 [Bacilli bacterium]